MPGTRSPDHVSTKLQRIAELARQRPNQALTTLAHHIDLAFLKEAHRRVRKDGATGVDRQTAAEYAKNLESNLESLLERFKAGTYRAPPVRRVMIPKGDGDKTRPIGIPTFEDKILQKAVTMVVEAVYEQEFSPCSYGFRPGRSAHQALQRLWDGVRAWGHGAFVLDVDIKAFFDSLDHGHLRRFLDQRVRDGVIRRAIDKWLNAGVLDAGRLVHPETGTPQGGIISPLLANIFLHEVLDKWFEADVKPRLKGPAFLVRYADDFVIVFSLKGDAERVLKVLEARMLKHGLTLHPQKTRLVPFRKPQPWLRTKAGSFDFLGFNHHWEKSYRGYWVMTRTTAASRFRRSLKAVAQWCRVNRHRSVADQQRALNAKLRGHYGYFGITRNFRALKRFYGEVQHIWRKWLDRRTGKRTMWWARFKLLLERYPLASPRIVHSVYSRAAKP